LKEKLENSERNKSRSDDERNKKILERNHIISERQLARLDMKEHSEDHFILNLPEIEDRLAEGDERRSKILEQKIVRSRKHSIEVEQKQHKALLEKKTGNSNLIQRIGEKLEKVALRMKQK